MLDVKLTVYNEPYDKEGGFREKLGVAGESSRSISIVLNLVMQILTRPSLSVGGQPLMDRTPATRRRCSVSCPSYAVNYD